MQYNSKNLHEMRPNAPTDCLSVQSDLVFFFVMVIACCTDFLWAAVITGGGDESRGDGCGIHRHLAKLEYLS